ncbi:hypothetical protein N7461_003437 [Penicillium sp. DV-2018c]|nr:hypothetical protein N7461_003437 [Penicillium sp. DV-2018c]
MTIKNHHHLLLQSAALRGHGLDGGSFASVERMEDVGVKWCQAGLGWAVPNDEAKVDNGTWCTWTLERRRQCVCLFQRRADTWDLAAGHITLSVRQQRFY